MPSHNQPNRQQENLEYLFLNRVQRIGEDALKRDPTLFYSSHNAAQASLGQYLSLIHI